MVNAVATTPVPRGWRYADHIPYQTPQRLEDLRGPTSGVVRVPHSINTAPNPVYDYDDPSDRWAGYSAIVRDGTAGEQEQFLDRDTLIRLWPDLNLPRRCREVWTAKFRELAVLPVRALVV
jgi:hypothetical protein